MKALLRTIGLAVLLAWTTWAYGGWFLFPDLVRLRGGGLMLAFFVTPLLAVLLIGFSVRQSGTKETPDPVSPGATSEARITKQIDTTSIALEVVGAIYSLAALALIFAGEHYPGLKPYARWGAIAFVAPIVLFIVGAGLFALVKGTADSVSLYRRVATQSDWVGRIVLAILFIIAYILALLRVRW